MAANKDMKAPVHSRLSIHKSFSTFPRLWPRKQIHFSKKRWIKKILGRIPCLRMKSLLQTFSWTNYEAIWEAKWRISHINATWCIQLTFAFSWSFSVHIFSHRVSRRNSLIYIFLLFKFWYSYFGWLSKSYYCSCSAFSLKFHQKHREISSGVSWLFRLFNIQYPRAFIG